MRPKIIILVLLVAVFAGLAFKYLRSPHETAEGTPSQTTSTDAKEVSEDQLVRAYVELATLAETTPIGTPEYEREKTRVLAQIGLEPGQIEKTLAKYNEHPEQWRPIWDRIQEELTKRTGDQGSIASPKGPRDSS